MSAAPPRLAVRLLTRALRHDPAAPAILGDLLEDFDGVARRRGPAAARRWYWREALSLSLRKRSGTLGSGLRKTAQTLALRGSRQDAAYALRNVRSSPGFALFTAIVMGLGIGAATSVFSGLKPLVLAPLPFPDAHELVWIANEPEPGDNSLSAVTSRSANLVDFRARSRLLDGVTGFNAFFDHAPYTLTGIDEPERLVGADVAHDFLDVLGVEPLLGRGFAAEEGRRGGPRAVILSHSLWQRRFASDEDIVGRSLSLNGVPRTVVGVLPPSFDFSSIFSPAVRVDVLLPFMVVADGDMGFQGNTLHLLGRLQPGVAPAAAQAELDAMLVALQNERPDRWGLGAVITPLQEHLAGPFRPALRLLTAAAATFLLLVCVNVSNLILARSMGRTREVAVRKALGAPRRRLIRQLVAETLLISLVGAALGTLLAWQVTQIVSGQVGVRIPLLDGVRVDGPALLFAITVSVFTGLLAGLFPALKMADGSEAAVLRDGGSAMSAGRRTRRLRESLVVVQVTLACVLLVSTGLLARSFRAVLAVDLGFEASNAVAWHLSPSGRFESFEQRTNFYAALTDRVAAVPGIDEVGLVDELPLGLNRTWGLWIVEPSGDYGAWDHQISPHVIDPGYLSAMRIPLVEGRNFTSDDREETRRVVLINESGARSVFGDGQALGRRLKFWGQSEWEVVGIVQDVRHISPEMGSGIQVYYPVAQMPDYHTLDLVVRSRLPVSQVAESVGAALHDVDPAMPTRELWTIQSTVDRAVSPRRFTLTMLAAFAAVALLVAGLGVYGVVANSVAERVPEIGIRMALGASGPALVWSVMARTLALAGMGTLAGAVLSLMASGLLASLIYGVGARDPATFLLGGLVLLAVAALAAAVPATRAARTSATAPLRQTSAPAPAHRASGDRVGAGVEQGRVVAGRALLGDRAEKRPVAADRVHGSGVPDMVHLVLGQHVRQQLHVVAVQVARQEVVKVGNQEMNGIDCQGCDQQARPSSTLGSARD